MKVAVLSVLPAPFLKDDHSVVSLELVTEKEGNDPDCIEAISFDASEFDSHFKGDDQFYIFRGIPSYAKRRAKQVFEHGILLPDGEVNRIASMFYEMVSEVSEEPVSVRLVGSLPQTTFIARFA